MRLTVISISLLLFSLPSVYADINVLWTQDGVVTENLDTLPPDPLPAGSLFQLIWTPDAAASPINPTDLTSPTGGEIVLNTYNHGGPTGVIDPSFGFDTGLLDGPVGINESYEDASFGTTLAGGFLYTRVFNSGSPDNTSFYGQTTPDGANPIPPDSNPSYQENVTQSDDDAVVQAGGTNVLLVNIVAIPEPGTLGLLAMGSLILFGFRRRR